MRKLALALPVGALGVGSAFAQDTAPDVSTAFTQLTASLNSVATSLGSVQTAVIGIAVGVAVIVVSRAVIKRFLKL